jgi:hypothetical protein
MAINDPYRNQVPQTPLGAGIAAGQAVRVEPDLFTVRERLNDLLGRQECEIGNLNNLLNELKDILGMGAAPCDKTQDGPTPMLGLENLTERLMKQHAQRDILLSELAARIGRRKG